MTFFLGFARHESPYSALVYEPRIFAAGPTERVIERGSIPRAARQRPWYVNMGVGELGLYERDVINYFTMDAAWYHMLAAAWT